MMKISGSSVRGRIQYFFQVEPERRKIAGVSENRLMIRVR